ncbi:MAG: alpha-2-macroglobulin family protein, partial [Acidobacteriota bacterium]
GQPVVGARVRVEHPVSQYLQPLFSGTTDDTGRLVWSIEASSDRGVVRRIIVEHDTSDGLDRLVLDPSNPPDVYRDGAFVEDHEGWLQWIHDVGGRIEKPARLAHVFSDRPVYRPEEPVHLVTYLRRYFQGRLQPIEQDARFVIRGPGGREWRLTAEVDAQGVGYARFAADEMPSGLYRVRVDAAGYQGLAEMTFKKEAYRLPRFEVLLNGPEGDAVVDGQATLDAPFRIDLAATYYAGGRVARRPVRWRVTQFPHAWTPNARDGFVYSSDGRFSRTSRFESTPALDREALTDDDGGAVLTLDPSIEPTAQSRVYVVEATVTGADDQTVTATRRVVALPPFLLGLDVPRFLEPGAALEPRVLVLGPDDQPLAGREVTVRLLHRQWHSHLRASDFSDGVARYITDVVDQPVHETTVTSTEEALAVPLPIGDPGVYVVEIEARDRLGRAQVVTVDLYAAGAQDAPVAWERPKDKTFAISTDAASYAPGDTARLILRSPFQEARALIVTETPDGNRYQWREVRGGEAVVELPIEGHWAPRLPVHAILMRGRVPGTAPRPGNAVDLGKPATLIATHWVEIQPRALRVEVGLDHPAEAMPGRTIDVEVRLKTPSGQPTAGTVALWLVDRAVLALGQERRLDPLPDFLKARESRLSIHDTRGLVFGDLPLVELPGGDIGMAAESVLDRQTVRRNIQPVPFFEPRVQVGPSGVATVEITLPDNLTDFAVRAKAVAGPMRFGFARSRLSVRLPVIVQPALPRFVRPGDRFTAAAIARVVSGEGGAGRAEMRVDGVELIGDPGGAIELPSSDPLRVDMPVRVPTPSLDDDGRPKTTEVTFQVGVERLADGAGDAFEVRLPVRDDRRPVVRREVIEIDSETPFTWPAIDDAVRPGTLSRAILLADRPGPVRLAAGLDALLDYPYGCTEQRISRARAQVAMTRFRAMLGLDEMADMQRMVDETIAYLREVVRDDGLLAYWPGGAGYVSLTAWTAQFLAEAREAGFEVDGRLLGTLRDTLRRALRSDYSGFVDGASWAERVMALEALAWLGDFDPAYGAELGRRSQFLVSEDLARLVVALERGGEKAATSRPELIEQLWQAIVFRLHQGQEIYGGLEGETVGNPLILPSETRTLSSIVRALARTAPNDPRLAVLETGLVRLGKGDGWGSTQADAAALLALAERLDPELPGSGTGYRIEWGDRVVDGAMVAATAWARGVEAEAVTIRADAPLVARTESRWVPAGDGATVESARRGFVVERTWSILDAPASNAPPRRQAIDQPVSIDLTVGTVVEEHVRVVSPRDRHFVAIVVPLAAGLEALNPRLATAPPEATPSGRDSLTPTFVDIRDDHVAYYFDVFPKGTHDLYFRARASIE